MKTTFPPDYAEQLHAGVLGKLIGVYLGRPVEGWPEENIRGKWGQIDRYVHRDQNVPLVVVDDDISGTFTFVRALEDSGRGLRTSSRDFGNTWLNTIIEGRSILWWGGAGCSTEHTAYLNLARGIRAPRSGSTKRNGRVVAEQIGAQIFIEGCGFVRPGDPRGAARLAREAARVSHDGEAVHAARVVAAMVAAAFVEKDIGRLLDIGVSVIPRDCLIAQIHRDVRRWCKGVAPDAWRTVYAKIKARYGYDRYGGGCHVVPNHALMVMAWALSGGRFHRALSIVVSAGWDTDCNAANVGSVMGLAVGLRRLLDEYDYLTPTGGRAILPTADGLESITDSARITRRLERIARSLCGAEDAPPRPWQDFSLPLALHGWVADDPDALTLSNPDGKGLRAENRRRSGPAVCRTPLFVPRDLLQGSYSANTVPVAYPGETIRVRYAGNANAKGSVRLEAHAWDETVPPVVAEAPAAGRHELSVRLSDTRLPWTELALSVPAGAGITVERVSHGGTAVLRFGEGLPLAGDQPLGWISSASIGPYGPSALRCSDPRGMIAIGTRDWTDESIAAELARHSASPFGLVLRQQGLRRCYLAVYDGTEMRIVRRRDDTDTILARKRIALADETHYRWKFSARGDLLRLSIAGKTILSAQDAAFASGGVGVYLESGRQFVRAIAVQAKTGRP